MEKMQKAFYYISTLMAILLGLTVLINRETGWGILFVILGLVLFIKWNKTGKGRGAGRF